MSSKYLVAERLDLALHRQAITCPLKAKIKASDPRKEGGDARPCGAGLSAHSTASLEGEAGLRDTPPGGDRRRGGQATRGLHRCRPRSSEAHHAVPGSGRRST